MAAAHLPASGRADADEERSLLEAAQSNSVAFGELYLRYLPRVYRYLRVRCGSDADAADLTQDVFERALAAFPRFRLGRTPFEAWLFTIARNRSVDARRRGMTAVPTLELQADVTGPAGDGTEPEPATLQREAYERTAALVARLDSDKRELLALRFAAGLTACEIAKVTGRSEASVKQQFTRLLRTLKEQAHDL